MNKQFTLNILLFFCISYATSAQCPLGISATLDNVVDNMDGTCSFDAEVFYATNGANNTSLTFTISICGGADLLTTGCFNGLRNADSPYTFLIDDAALVAPCNASICVTYNGWTNPNCNNSGCTPTDNSVTVNGSLPVDLVAFTAHTKALTQIKLEWLTSSEDQNAYFMVQRSTNGRTFEDLGRVEGNGTSTVENYYQFLDKNPIDGENYYRLKQTNFDQSFEYSDVISIKMETDFSAPLIIAPSIAEEEVTLIFHELPMPNRMVEIFDIEGVNVLNTSLPDGAFTLKLDIANFDPGMYFIRVPIDREFVVKKFIKVGK